MATPQPKPACIRSSIATGLRRVPSSTCTRSGTRCFRAGSRRKDMLPSKAMSFSRLSPVSRPMRIWSRFRSSKTRKTMQTAASLAATLAAHPRAHGVLLSRHGLYTWSQSVAEARRHLEALEFLFEVEGRRFVCRGPAGRSGHYGIAIADAIPTRRARWLFFASPALAAWGHGPFVAAPGESRIESDREVAAALAPLGIDYERWSLDRLPADASAEQVLEAYASRSTR